MAREVNEYIMRIYMELMDDETTPLIQFEFVAVSYEHDLKVKNVPWKNDTYVDKIILKVEAVSTDYPLSQKKLVIYWENYEFLGQGHTLTHISIQWMCQKVSPFFASVVSPKGTTKIPWKRSISMRRKACLKPQPSDYHLRLKASPSIRDLLVLRPTLENAWQSCVNYGFFLTRFGLATYPSLKP